LDSKTLIESARSLAAWSNRLVQFGQPELLEHYGRQVHGVSSNYEELTEGPIRRQ
jgi:hypothetical protein